MDGSAVLYNRACLVRSHLVASCCQFHWEKYAKQAFFRTSSKCTAGHSCEGAQHINTQSTHRHKTKRRIIKSITAQKTSAEAGSKIFGVFLYSRNGLMARLAWLLHHGSVQRGCLIWQCLTTAIVNCIMSGHTGRRRVLKVKIMAVNNKAEVSMMHFVLLADFLAQRCWRRSSGRCLFR